MLGGCSVACKGPGCEGDWPATRVAIHRGADLTPGARDAWNEARGVYDGAEEDGAGWAVAGAPGVLAFGRPEADDVVVVDDREEPGATFTANAPPPGQWTGRPRSRFGRAVALTDATGDGRLDLWATAPDEADLRGALYLFTDALAAGAGTQRSAHLRVAGVQPGDRFGDRMALCGDLTGDGLPDLLVTAPWLAAGPLWPDVPPLAGGIVLVRSEVVAVAGGVVTADALGPVWWGEATGDRAGAGLACTEDLTGDGVLDIAIGAPWHGDTRGRVYVISGHELPPSGSLADVAAITIDGPSGQEWFGASLAALEIDGRLPADLAVGAPGYDRGRGRVHVFTGRTLTGDGEPRPMVELHPAPGQDADHLGRWLAAGDLDGDGLSDLVVGAPDLRGGRNVFDVGRAWVWFGAGARDWPFRVEADLADVAITGSHAFQRVGRAPWVGDLDGDGLDDLVLTTRRAVR